MDFMTDWNEYGSRRSPSRNRLLFKEHRLTTEKFIDYFKDLDVNLSVLDVGCGDGFWMEVLRNLGFRDLLGLDLSYSLLMRAKGKGLRVMQSSASCMSFRRKFDVVIMCDVLEHLPDVSETLSKVRDVLKSDGILYLMIPVYDSLSNRFQRLFHRKSKIQQAQEHDETHLHAFSKRDLVSLLNSHHFQVERSVYTANRLPGVTGKIQRLTFGNRFGNWLSIVARVID
jgi:2-polyprenyl-3-methyl-5-hydroxy-6-metoxy-1,4-benzoquinol methylase